MKLVDNLLHFNWSLSDSDRAPSWSKLFVSVVGGKMRWRQLGIRNFYAHPRGTLLQFATRNAASCFRFHRLACKILTRASARTGVVPRIVLMMSKATKRALINHPSRQHFLLVASLLTSSVISLGEKEQEGRVGNSEEKIGWEREPDQESCEG